MIARELITRVWFISIIMLLLIRGIGEAFNISILMDSRTSCLVLAGLLAIVALAMLLIEFYKDSKAKERRILHKDVINKRTAFHN